MYTIYDEMPAYLDLYDLAQELIDLGEIDLKDGESVTRYAFDPDLEVATFSIGTAEGVTRLESFDIWDLREMGIGGTAEHIAFGRDPSGEYVLLTFMDYE